VKVQTGRQPEIALFVSRCLSSRIVSGEEFSDITIAVA